MNFDERLDKGEFCIPQCTECKKIVWPPLEFCNSCFGAVHLKEGEFEGKIIEFSRENEQFFCMVEFENSIRIMAHITDTPEIGQTVKISNCGIKEDNYFFQVI